MTITVRGTLTLDAQKRTEVGQQHAVVTLSVRVGPGYPAEARLSFKDDHRRAEAVAAAARRGAEVRIEADGFFPRIDHSTAAIVLTGVTAAYISGVAVFP